MKCCQAVLARNKDICQNIMIPKKERNGDIIYNFSEGRNYKQTCIPFSRSEALCDVGKSLGHWQKVMMSIGIFQQGELLCKC